MHRFGFTLVELLSVIAIIALLMAVSLGVISKTINFGQSAKCMGNLRSINGYFQNYLSDHDFVMPQRFYPDSPGSHNGVAYFNLLSPYTGEPDPEKATTVFVCPSHPNCRFPVQPSYGMNWYYDNSHYVNVAGGLIMIAESAGDDGTGSNRADENNLSPGELDSTRHSGSSNFLFFDGHVQKLTYAATSGLWGTDQGNHNQPPP